MTHYIDGFVFPIARDQLNTYKHVSEQVANIWVEHGATHYAEFVDDQSGMTGTQSFAQAINTSSQEVVIFGWVTFSSKKVRDAVNEKVFNDPRMEQILAPLHTDSGPIFDAGRMVYSGFSPLVQAPSTDT